MTLLKLFNRTLRDLPSITNNLENSIMEQGWSKQKSQQAIKIVRQLKKTRLIEAYYDCNCVSLSMLTITLSPSECNINNRTTFSQGNIGKAEQYVMDLLTDINSISAYVEFRLSNLNLKGDKCEFEISWEI